jgi:hypothetical protein
MSECQYTFIFKKKTEMTVNSLFFQYISMTQKVINQINPIIYHDLSARMFCNLNDFFEVPPETKIVVKNLDIT